MGKGPQQVLAGNRASSYTFTPRLLWPRAVAMSTPEPVPLGDIHMISGPWGSPTEHVHQAPHRAWVGEWLSGLRTLRDVPGPPSDPAGQPTPPGSCQPGSFSRLPRMIPLSMARVGHWDAQKGDAGCREEASREAGSLGHSQPVSRARQRQERTLKPKDHQQS